MTDFFENIVIFHVDMDAFYPSIEQRDAPHYKGKPVIVGADPKEGKGRGVVASCSYEAREYGIRSGMPISQAYKACPNGIFLRPRFEVYTKVSQQIIKILERYTKKIQQTSIDEAYLDFTGKIFTVKQAKELAISIKEAIKKEVQLTCSIGVSSSKIIAKIASDLNKPDGLMIIPTKDTRKYLDDLPPSKIPGIGPKTETWLKSKGVFKISDVTKLSLQQAAIKYGNVGVFIWQVANGLKNSPLKKKNERRKSISKDTTFMEDTSNIFKIRLNLMKMLEKVTNKLNDRKYLARTIVLKIRYNDFSTRTKSFTFSHPKNDLSIFERTLNELLNHFLPLEKPVRLVGVALSNLVEIEKKQKTLLDFA